MRNFIRSSALLFIFVLSLFGSATSSNAQQGLIPGSVSPAEFWTQFWNTGNVYRNVAKSQIGYIVDSGTSGTIWLVSSKFITGRGSAFVNSDTVVPAPINGNGNVVITAYAWRASTTQTVVPNCVYNLYQSNDGIKYTPVLGASTFTLQPSAVYSPSLTPVSCSWNMTYKPARFLGVKVVFSLDSASTALQMYMNSNVYSILPSN